MPSINDDFADAIEVTIATNGGTYTSSAVDTAGNTTEPGEPAVSASADVSAWWKYTPSSSGSATFDTQLSTPTGSGTDTYVAIWTGTNFGDMVNVASDDDAGGSGTSLISGLSVTGGTTYWIQVGGFGLQTMNVVTRVTGPASGAAAAATVAAHWLQRPPGRISPAGRSPWVGVSGATAADIAVSIDTAILTLTGETSAAAGSDSAALAVDVATLTLTTETPATAGSGTAIISTDVATLTLTGQTPTAAGTGDASTAVDVAALVLTGETTALTGSGIASTAVDVSTLTLTGQTPLASSGDIAVEVDPAALVLSGVTPTLTGVGDAAIALDTVVLSLSAVTPTLVGAGAAAVAVDAGALSLAGSDIDFVGSGTSAWSIDAALLSLVGVTPGATGVEIVTPPERTIVVPAEDRVMVVEPENRVVVVPAENRMMEA